MRLALVTVVGLVPLLIFALASNLGLWRRTSGYVEDSVLHACGRRPPDSCLSRPSQEHARLRRAQRLHQRPLASNARRTATTGKRVLIYVGRDAPNHPLTATTTTATTATATATANATNYVVTATSNASHHRHHHHRPPPTTDHRPPTTDHRPPTTDHRPPTCDHHQTYGKVASKFLARSFTTQRRAYFVDLAALRKATHTKCDIMSRHNCTFGGVRHCTELPPIISTHNYEVARYVRAQHFTES